MTETHELYSAILESYRDASDEDLLLLIETYEREMRMRPNRPLMTRNILRLTQNPGYRAEYLAAKEVMGLRLIARNLTSAATSLNS